MVANLAMVTCLRRVGRAQQSMPVAQKAIKNFTKEALYSCGDVAHVEPN